jgi:hypothetical protein
MRRLAGRNLFSRERHAGNRRVVPGLFPRWAKEEVLEMTPKHHWILIVACVLLFAAIGLKSARGEEEEDCGTPETLAVEHGTHPNIVAHYILTPHKTYLGLTELMVDEAPPESVLTGGFVLVRSDNAILFRIWSIDGKCATVVINPTSSYRFLAAVKGRTT